MPKQILLIAFETTTSPQCTMIFPFIDICGIGDL